MPRPRLRDDEEPRAPRMHKEREYIRLRSSLAIDPLALNEELVEFPMLLMDCCEIAGECLRERDRCDMAYKTALALAAAELREEPLQNGKARSEAAVSSEAPLQEGPQEAMAALEQAKANLSYWNALVDAMKAKQSSLRRMCDLHVSGYMSSASAVEDARREMAEARRAKARRRVSGGCGEEEGDGDD